MWSEVSYIRFVHAMQLLLDDSVRLLQRLGKNLIIPSLRFPAALGERRSKDWTQKNQGVSGVFVYFSVEGISKGVRSLFLPKNSTQQIWPRLAQNMTSEEICFFFLPLVPTNWGPNQTKRYATTFHTPCEQGLAQSFFARSLAERIILFQRDWSFKTLYFRTIRF